MDAFINNQWTGSPNGGIMEVRDPANGDMVGSVPRCDRHTVGTAVEAAELAREGWEVLGWKGRCGLVEKFADRIESHKEDLARSLTVEQGKPLAESLHEVASAAGTLRYYAGLEPPGRCFESNGLSIEVEPRPVGLCALVLPWNYPVGVLMWKLAPALVAGCTVVCKPSPYTPMTALKLAELGRDIFPPGTINVVPGDDETGKALVTDRRVDRVAFTGALETGKDILTSTAPNLPRVSLELGGNDAAVVLKDADLKTACAGLFWTAFRNAGQICIATKRLYVHRDIFSRVVKNLASRAEAVVLGHGLDQKTQMGPLNNMPQLEKVTQLVEDANNRGARPVAGGGPPNDEGLSRGHFFSPTIMVDVDDDMPLVSSEQFGPVLPVMPFDDVDEVIDRVNATGYGLGGSLWTSDLDRGRELGRRMRCGTVWLNTHMRVDDRAPFGGVPRRGLGKELGLEGLAEYLDPQTVMINRA